MNASGRTLTVWELYRELASKPVDAPVYVVGDPSEDPIPVRRVDLNSDRLELTVDADALVDGDGQQALVLLRSFLAKEITAKQLREDAKNLLGEE